jgi:hypothetical protein
MVENYFIVMAISEAYTLKLKNPPPPECLHNVELIIIFFQQAWYCFTPGKANFYDTKAPSAKQ